jgi:cytochrome c oxidase assembly protein subunit 11
MDDPTTDRLERRSRFLAAENRTMLGKLLVVACMMFGFGYALVPMYRAICDALGINVLSVAEQRVGNGYKGDGGGTGGSAGTSGNTQVDFTRTITIEFDANARGPWDFKPAQRSITAQAIPSYAPGVAMSHFNKLECFCFTEHVLAPGESKRWPVTFFVDTKLPKDVGTITLSYTFFEVNGKVPQAPGEGS